MRSVAKVLRRENSQAIALRIADEYDRLAEQAEAEAAKILQWPAPKTWGPATDRPHDIRRCNPGSSEHQFELGQFTKAPMIAEEPDLVDTQTGSKSSIDERD